MPNDNGHGTGPRNEPGNGDGTGTGTATALLVWAIGSITGVVGGVEHFLHDIGFAGFHFMSVPVVGSMLLLSAAGMLGVTAFTTLMALAYNYYAATLGHVTIEVDDGDIPAVAPPVA
jgi:hypothetical protein